MSGSDRPFVSIIIPCHNAAPYVAAAVSSALAQTYLEREVIVIDDGSADGSLRVIQSFGDTIRWETGANQGACRARNRGLALSRGEFIQFLDADDLLDPEKLTRQVPVACLHRRAIVCCDFRTEILHEAPNPLICARRDSRDSVIFALSTIIHTSAPLYPREELERVCGWRDDLPCAQDYELNLRLAVNGARFLHQSEVLYTVRRRPGSISSDSVRVLDQWREIYWESYHFLQEHAALTDARAEAFAAGFVRHARAYIRHGLYEKATARFNEAFQMHPSGGLRMSYGRWTRILQRLLGPFSTERLVQLKRRLTTRAIPGNV